VRAARPYTAQLPEEMNFDEGTDTHIYIHRQIDRQTERERKREGKYKGVLRDETHKLFCVYEEMVSSRAAVDTDVTP